MNQKRAVLLVILSMVAPPAMAQTLEVHGHAGILGEWELVGTVTPNGREGIHRSAEDDACRRVHPGRPGGEGG